MLSYMHTSGKLTKEVVTYICFFSTVWHMHYVSIDALNHIISNYKNYVPAVHHETNTCDYYLFTKCIRY
jgi:hypothetical protein